jgi:hypothetical protein
MSLTTISLPQTKTYPAELKTLLERGNAGDASALPELKRAFLDNPELAAHLGDLVQHAEQALLQLAAGTSLTAQAAIQQQMTELRASLSGEVASPLEKLLVDRIVISWIEVYHGDIELAGQLLRQGNALPAIQAAQRRLDGAHRRYLTAIKQLAVVRKLLRPSPSPLDLLKRSVPETDGRCGRGQFSAALASRVLVSN